MRLSSLSPFVVGAALIPQTLAWGAVGHEVVATIAQMYLHPSVMPKLCEILDYRGKCHLAPVASWADTIRGQAKYKWTGPLHYIGAVDDYPSATCAFPGPNGWEGRTHINVLHGIWNTTNVLQEFEVLRRAGVRAEFEPGYVQDAVKFLIHFIGDMHMPLHLTGRNRGGNDDKVAFEGRSTNLHSVWDSLLISERLRTLPQNYTRPLPIPEVESYLRDTIYDPYIRRLVWEGLLGKYQDEIDTWLVCPASSSSVQHPPPPPSAWQHVLSLFSSAGKGRDESGVEDGGLGVDDDTLCPYAWAKPIHQLNCDIVFPKELDEVAPFGRLSSRPSRPQHASDHGHVHEDEDEDEGWSSEGREASASSLTGKKSAYLELLTPEYAGVIKEQWIIEKLLTQASIRLAAVLNWVFAELGEDDEGRYMTL